MPFMAPRKCAKSGINLQTKQEMILFILPAGADIMVVGTFFVPYARQLWSFFQFPQPFCLVRIIHA
jgi:hypothetical protein